MTTTDLLRHALRCVPAAAAALTLAAPAGAAAAVARVEVRTGHAIRDGDKVPARLTAGGRSYRAAIELRGESSRRFHKKPYTIETARRVRLLGMPPERDWDLNAFYTDPTLMRDVLAHAAASRMGLTASRTRYVELRLNGHYRGVYVLMEPPELSDRRVRAKALLELTQPGKVDAGDDSFVAAGGLRVVFTEPDDGRKKKSRAARAAVGAFEASLAAGGDWRAHVDERSAIDYILHAELFRNQDAFHSSTYVHHRKDGRLAFGPVWDFDLSAGNTTDPAFAAPEGWTVADRTWSGALLADQRFRVALAARWRALRAAGFVETLLAKADKEARTLDAPARRNYARWRTLQRPVFTHQPVHGSHAAAVAALKAWLTARAAWMDRELV